MKRQKMIRAWKLVPMLAVLALVLAFGIVATPQARQVEANPATIYVPDDYSTIQAAVNASSPGTTIIVRDGIYYENVRVSTASLTIKSKNGAANCIVSASNPDDHVLYVNASWVNITGFTVENATLNRNSCTGIFLYYADHCTISDNNATNNYIGIRLSHSNNNILTNNSVSDNRLYGIRLDSSSNNVLTNSTTWDNADGIDLEDSSNNTITNNNVLSNGWDGISISGDSNENTVTNNNVLVNRERGVSNSIFKHGVELGGSSNVLSENTISNSMFGIYLGGYHNIVTNNTVSNNSYSGIYLSCSSNSILTNNTISGSLRNFAVGGYNFSHYIQDIDTSNTVDGKPIYYWVNHHDEQVPRDAGYVAVANSTHITVKDLVLNGNQQGMVFAFTDNSRIENVTTLNNVHGILLTNSNNNTLTNNNVSNSEYEGIYLEYSSNNTLTNNIVSKNDNGIGLLSSNNNILTNNTASSNDKSGIYLYSSGNNILTGNTASSNKQGIDLSYMWYSENNSIYLNDFINNTDGNVISRSSDYTWKSTWKSTEQLTYTYQSTDYTNYLGNYWSDYDGSDPDGDGIGNSPYLIVDDNNDTHPLMESFENYQVAEGTTNSFPSGGGRVGAIVAGVVITGLVVYLLVFRRKRPHPTASE